MLSLSRRDVRRWRRAVVERRWMRAVVERRWMRSCGGEALDESCGGEALDEKLWWRGGVRARMHAYNG